MWVIVIRSMKISFVRAHTTRDPLSTGNLLGPEDTFIQSNCTTQPNMTMEHINGGGFSNQQFAHF
jgi:hypothetical protein